MKFPHLSVLAVLLSLSACTTGNLDFPKGTSKGYSSARLITIVPGRSTEPEFAFGQAMIRQSIARQFKANGLEFTDGPADLIVAHLVVIQDNDSTTYLDEYFGSTIEAEAISDLAHRRGVIEGKEREAFNRAGLVVDVLDARTNELVFRNYVKRDILPPGTSNTVRAQFIEEAVAETLQPFFVN